MTNIGRRLSEYIEDLPEHLKKDVEKNFGRDELAAKICKVLEEQLDGVGTIDEILIALVKFEQVGPELKSRRYLLNKLYRMSETEKILAPYLDENGNRKKGTYRLPHRQPQAERQEQKSEPQPAPNPEPEAPAQRPSSEASSYQPQALFWKKEPLERL